jgi:hypothetical protein
MGPRAGLDFAEKILLLLLGVEIRRLRFYIETESLVTK